MQVQSKFATLATELPGPTFTVRGTEMRKLLIAAASMLVLSGAAQAAPTMLLEITTSDNQGTISCTIGSVLNSQPTCTSTLAGMVMGVSFFNQAGALNMSVLGGIGGWTFGLSTMTSNAPGLQTGSSLGMTFANVSKGATGTGNLTFSLSGDGFTMPSGPVINMAGSASLTSSFPGVNGVSASFASQQNGNLPLNAPTASAACDFSLNGGVFGCGIAPQQWIRTGSETFSMRDVVTFDIAAGTSGVGGSSTVTATNGVPEPMTAALVGLGLFGAAFFSRRRASKQA
jgi:hypothetical protein